MIRRLIQKSTLVFVILFALAGCAKETPSSTDIDNTGIMPTSTPMSTTVPPEDNINSEQIGEDKSGSEKGMSDFNFTLPSEGIRPYAVMIDNEGPRPLPQGGIYLAQVIYEIIVEGGTTRLMPVFWDKNPTMIGPVRSSRHYFLDYAMEHDAIYVHFGYSPMAMQDLKKFKINNIDRKSVV